MEGVHTPPKQKEKYDLRVFKNFAWLSLSRLLGAVLQAITLLLVARNSGPILFGVLSVYLGLTVVLQTTTDLGISTYIIRQRAMSPNSPEVGWALGIYRWLAFVLLILLLAVAFLVSSSNEWWMLIPLVLSGVIERQIDVRLGIALADGDVWKNALSLLVRRTLTFCTFLIAINLLIINPILSFGLASLLSCVVGMFLASKLVPAPVSMFLSINILKRIFNDSKGFWVNSFAVQFRNVDALVVSTVASPMIAGLYGAVARAVGPLRLFSSSLAAVILPTAVKSKGEERTALMRGIGAVITILSLCYVVIAFFADPIVGILLGADYIEVVPALQIVLVGLIFASLSSIQSSLLQAEGAQMKVGVVAAVTTMVALIGIGFGAVAAGITGAAMGLASSYVIQCLLLFICLKTKKEIEIP